MSVIEANAPVSDLLAETRLLKRRLLMSEAAKDRKSKAKSKTKELLKKKKAKAKSKGKEGSGGKKHSPYKRLSSRGQPPEKASQFTGFSDNFFGKKGLTKMPKSGKWDCKKAGKYRQVCTNSETGAKKIIVIDPGYKKTYNAGYAKASAAGQTNAANAKG